MVRIKLNLLHIGRRLSFLLVAVLVMALFSMQVAADCCVYQGQCTTSSSNCPPGFFVTGASCSTQSECQMGCCCQENTAKRQGQCLAVAGNTFNPDATLNAGATCSCQTGHSIAGTILLNGNPAPGAAVSASGVYAQSGSGTGAGQYLLSAVPSGSSIVISASLNGCFGNTTISSFNSDRTGVNINLVCSCTPGCNTVAKSYCDAQSFLQTYDVNDPNQRSLYCQYCAAEDSSVCGSFSVCRPNDGTCPLSCTPSNDADCACNINTRNGVCPVGCTDVNDLDCRAGSNPQCGDGIVSYPFETCEQNPQPGQVSLCAAGACNACNCVTSNTCGNGVIDQGESCELGNICSDGSACLNCACNAVCAGSSVNPALSGTYVATSRQARLTWALSTSCGSNIASYELWKCLRSGSNTCTDRATFTLQGTYSRTQLNASDVVPDASVNYYYVRARYTDGTSGVSTTVQVTSGETACLNGQTGEFCLSDRRSRCNANNNIQVIEDCGVQGRFCTGPDVTGATSCTAEDACSMCNGLYGMFARYLDLRVTVGSNTYFCNDGAGREVVPGCYYDASKSIFNAYNSCGDIRSCYDYKSEDACTDPADPCGKNAGCEWAAFPGNPSIGGVCRPRNAQIQDCTLCDSNVYNSISPTCTPDTCRLFGSCYFQGVGNSPSCSSNRVSTCTMLDSVTSCEGPASNRRGVLVNATYDATPLRIGGTHVVTPSNDNSSLGKCYWDSVNLRCRRDADGLRVDFSRNIGFDCASGDVMCESDFANPATMILSSQLGAYRANPVLFYSSQDVYPSSRISTYFCIARAGTRCYPTETGLASANDKYYAAPYLNSSGLYTVFYYSVDPAQNLEVVRNVTILVDADPPFIDILSPSNLSEIAFNNLTMPVQGRTSTDASYVCANNTYTRRTLCINNCQKPGAGTPCIDAQGYFNMSIPLASSNTDAANVTRNIIFYAEDYAGNRYSNTLLGILFDITPPALPTITVR